MCLSAAARSAAPKWIFWSSNRTGIWGPWNGSSGRWTRRGLVSYGSCLSTWESGTIVFVLCPQFSLEEAAGRSWVRVLAPQPGPEGSRAVMPSPSYRSEGSREQPVCRGEQTVPGERRMKSLSRRESWPAAFALAAASGLGRCMQGAGRGEVAISILPDCRWGRG